MRAGPVSISFRWIALGMLLAGMRPMATAQQQGTAAAAAQKRPPSASDSSSPVPTRFDILRGSWGPYRANNTLLYYHLDVRVDPEKKFISGKNTIRFRMVADGTRIQIDLTDQLNIDKILLGDTPLQ